MKDYHRSWACTNARMSFSTRCVTGERMKPTKTNQKPWQGKLFVWVALFHSRPVVGRDSLVQFNYIRKWWQEWLHKPEKKRNPPSPPPLNVWCKWNPILSPILCSSTSWKWWSSVRLRLSGWETAGWVVCLSGEVCCFSSPQEEVEKDWWDCWLELILINFQESGVVF